MVKFLSNWAQGIVVAVILATIIEMILPNGSLKKYVKVVIGIYILFSMISPILEKMSSKIDIDNIFDISDYEQKIEESDKKIFKKLDNNNNRNIKDIYLENLENDIRSRLEQKNYGITTLKIAIKDEENYKISKIEIVAYAKNKNIKINEVEINSEGKKEKPSKSLTDEQIKEVKEYLGKTYDISEDIVFVT